MHPFRILCCLALASALSLGAQTPRRILFDHTRHEEAGTSAEWVICTASEPDPSPANPTTETDWNGGISAWAFDLYKAGYTVQSLPPTGRVTYGDTSNAQDLSHYAAYIIDEPYILFTAAEKQAILSYVQHGGGLFVVGNHVGAARYSGGTDAYTVFNDMVQVNGTNPYGFTFVPGHGPGDALANTTSTAFTTSSSLAAQAIVNGSFGSLGMMDFHSYSYLNYSTAQNPSVQEILHTQVSGDSGSFIVTCTVGSGRVVAISDSAPADDGTTTTSGKSLHVSWPNNSNRAFFMNATTYLAGAAATAPVPVVSISSPATDPTITAGGSVSFQGSATISDGSALSYSWSFGDGATAAVQGPVNHTYTTAGTYTATFTATSNQGQAASATRTVTVSPTADTQPPTVSVSESGTSGTISFSASATDNVGVTKVEFYVDGALVGTDTASPYTLASDSTKLTNGTHTLVAKAYDAAANVGTSASVAFSVNNPTGGGTTTQIMGNPGFETGSASPWVASTGVLDNGTSEAAHSGSWKAWLDGYGSSHTDSLYQQVAIDPTATAATLTFWLHIDTAETTTTAANDTLKVQVRNGSGTVLATLATYSNLNASTGFTQKSFDLTSYKGQTIQIYLVGTEDSSNQTSFVVDDFALNVTTSGSGSDTTPPTVSVTESGSTGTITFNATASDNVGVTKVEFYVDGILKGTDTASPYTLGLDSTTLANGGHSLTAKAYDAAGNVGSAPALSFSVSNSVPTGSSLAESFDTGTKTSYTAGPVTLSTGTWTLTDALLGSSTSDAKNGAQSVRVRNSGKVTMGFDFATGAQTVSVKHAKFGTDASSTWGLWYSTDGGSTWIQAGNLVTTSSTTLAAASFTVNVTGTIRFEIRKTDGTSNRVNFDDFTIAGY
ncbi:MAG TPA: Ig-like domain-containing protein [Geothrix sp.]|nr:Ig-like domain-containing protein [Geothrix sp.]